MTIVVSSHILDELSKIATRYGVIHQGKMVDAFSREELELRCRQNLRLTVNNPEKAVALLEQKVTEDLEIQPNGDILLYDRLDRAAEINALLMNSQIMVSALVPVNRILRTISCP